MALSNIHAMLFVVLGVMMIILGEHEANAIYRDDVGVLDFSVATSGHGAIGWVHHSVSDDLVITTDISTRVSATTSCFVAGRQISDGSLVWRRNVCSVPDEETQAHAIAIRTTNNNEYNQDQDQDGDVVFYTVDNVGIVRAWTVNNGDLLWDAKISSSSSNTAPRLFVVDYESSEDDNTSFVAVSAGDELVFLDAKTGTIVDTISASKAMGGSAKNGQHVEWLSVLSSSSSSSSSSTIKMTFAKVQTSDGTIASGNDFYVGMYEIGGSNNVKASSSGQIKAKNIVADSVRAFSHAAGKEKSKEDFHIWAVTTSGSVVHMTNGSAEVSSAQDWNEKWSAVVAVESVLSSSSSADFPLVMRLSGKSESDKESTMELFKHDQSSSSWKSILDGKSSDDNNNNSAVAFCPTMGLVVTTPNDRSVEVYQSSSSVESKSFSPLKTTVTGDVFGADGDSVVVVSVINSGLSLNSATGSSETTMTTTMTVLVGTERGSTTMFSLTTTTNGNEDDGTDTVVNVKVHWTAEEGLSSLSSAIILDASHFGSDDLVEEKDEVAYRLSMAGRLKAQWQEVGIMLSTANGLIGNSGDAVSFNYRDHLFGFLKVSALLSPKAHRMWGMSTAGKDRGSIRWSLDLPKTALWHSMVHGTTNAAKAVHGIHGDTHSREILVLSASSDKVDWMCIDGTSGAINAQDSIPISSPIQQVVPVYGTSTGGCRQASLLLSEDLGLTVVPADAETDALIQKQLHKTPNGLYTHKIDTVANKVESYRVSHEQDDFVARPVGLTSFAGEQIVKVAYPLRHEDVQSMSTILGDNSLLLKYINPHMAVVVTMLSDEKDQTATEVATALQKEVNGKPRKPVGAGAPGSSTTSQQPPEGGLPNMFVNLVDTVSGRVLYRHSHSNVDEDKKVSVVISENWVVYTYVNAKTRRTEIGVLTLHEGMIEPKGLTYFARPDQSSSFSSFDARESKPVVLAKVYTFPKSVTALGVTSTRQGISRQNILLASSDGALNTINKMILETRRPVGDAKPDEKKEGLLPYRELIPESPLFSLTYNQTMEPFTSIISTTTSLESQSLVFGFGGPDLFFTRTSPTKGFDLLPENFNKVMVGATTVGVVIALFVVQRMGKKKALKQGWL